MLRFSNYFHDRSYSSFDSSNTIDSNYYILDGYSSFNGLPSTLPDSSALEGSTVEPQVVERVKRGAREKYTVKDATRTERPVVSSSRQKPVKSTGISVARPNRAEGGSVSDAFDVPVVSGDVEDKRFGVTGRGGRGRGGRGGGRSSAEKAGVARKGGPSPRPPSVPVSAV